MLKLTRPLHLLLATLTFAFGASLADYLGKPFRADSFCLGLVMILLLQVTMNLLPEVYRPQNEPLLENETRADKLTLRNNALYISMAALASIAVIAYSLYNAGHLPPATFFYLIFSLVVILLYSIPPFRLINRGFGEILLAVQLAYLFPSMAFTFQNGATHRFLVLAIPLTF